MEASEIVNTRNPSTIKSTKGGQAFGESHCCPLAMEVVAMPASWIRSVALRESNTDFWIDVVLSSASRIPAQRGMKEEMVEEPRGP
jgi:hypothetical protein